MDYKREISLFEYFFFRPLNYSETVGCLQECHPSIDQSTVAVVYKGWLSTFQRKALLFYQSQYRKHQELTWLSFCQHYEVPDYESPGNLGLEYEWDDWEENYQLNDHYKKYQNTTQGLSEVNNEGSDRAKFVITEIETINKDLDRFWFNGLINNSMDLVAKLRALPYEMYLETSHWKRVRAAMILIKGGACKARQCAAVGESWYGGNESDLEIHHRDYSNRGNERFDQLAVLCGRHHKLLHQSLRDSGKIEIEII